MIFLKSHGKLSQFSQIIVPGQIKKFDLYLQQSKKIRRKNQEKPDTTETKPGRVKRQLLFQIDRFWVYETIKGVSNKFLSN